MRRVCGGSSSYLGFPVKLGNRNNKSQSTWADSHRKDNENDDQIKKHRKSRGNRAASAASKGSCVADSPVRPQWHGAGSAIDASFASKGGANLKSQAKEPRALLPDFYGNPKCGSKGSRKPRRVGLIDPASKPQALKPPTFRSKSP